MDVSAHPKPPRKPLTPYMRYSKSIWQSVKEVNPNLSVCEIGATIGKMWRELQDHEKQKYNEDFMKEKAKYEEEIQAYLKMTGLQASDLNKSKSRKKAESKQREQQQAATQPVMGMTAHHPMGLPAMPPPGYPVNSAAMLAQAQGQYQAAANSAGAAAGGLPHFSQIWATAQYQQGVPMAVATTMNGPMDGSNVSVFYQAAQQHVAQQQAQAAAQQQQQAQAAAQQQQQQQHQQTTGEQINAHMYNGSPQLAQAPSPGMNQASPMAQQQQTQEQLQQQQVQEQLQQQQAQAAEQLQQQQVGAQVTQADALNLVTAEGITGGGGNNAWSWHAPSGQFLTQTGQQISLVQVDASGNLQAQTIEQTQGQPTLDTASQDSNMSHSSAGGGGAGGGGGDGSPAVQEAHTPQAQPTQSPSAPERPASSSSNHHTPEHGQQEGENNTSQETKAETSSSAASLPQYPSAHNTFNSYANYPWATLSSQGFTNSGQANTNGKAVATKESILETELQHLRAALSEKTKEVQRLTQELEKAHNIIEQLRQAHGQVVVSGSSQIQ